MSVVNARAVTGKSNSRADPTNTKNIVRKFNIDSRKRFKQLIKEIVQLVVIEDAFGLKNNPSIKQFEVPLGNTRWAFQTDQQKLEAFQRWIRSQINEKIMGSGQAFEDAYWNKYIEEAYKKGGGRAFDQIKKPLKFGAGEGQFYKGSKQQFLESSFNRPASINRVKLLAGRVLTDLSGVTEKMATQMSRILVDGLITGKGPRDIASQLVERVNKIGVADAERIARTEVIRAHAEGQLDAFQELGVDKVGVMAEWSTAFDDRVCPLCAPMDGAILTVDEARGIIPRHPNCRCMFVPANLGESTKGQKRGKQAILKAKKKSLKAEGKTAKDSAWPLAQKPIAKTRPKSPLTRKKVGPSPTEKTIQKAAEKGVTAEALKAKALEKLNKLPCSIVSNSWATNLLDCEEVNIKDVMKITNTKVPKFSANDWKDNFSEVEMSIDDISLPTANVNKAQIKKVLTNLENGKETGVKRVVFMEETGEFIITDSGGGYQKIVAEKLFGNTTTKVHMKTVPKSNIPSVKIAPKPAIPKTALKGEVEVKAPKPVKASSPLVDRGSQELIKKHDDLENKLLDLLDREGFVIPGNEKHLISIRKAQAEIQTKLKDKGIIPRARKEGNIKKFEWISKDSPNEVVSFERTAKEALKETTKPPPVKSTYRKDYDDWIKSLSKEEKKAIEHWSVDMYTVGDFRDVHYGKETTAEIRKLVETADAAIDRAPKYKGTIYRGEDIDASDFDLSTMKVGDEFSFGEKSYTSTSKSLDVAEEFSSLIGDRPLIYEIKTKTGVDIENLVIEGYEEQREVILTKGTKFRIESIKTVTPRASKYPQLADEFDEVVEVILEEI